MIYMTSNNPNSRRWFSNVGFQIWKFLLSVGIQRTDLVKVVYLYLMSSFAYPRIIL